MKRFSEIVKEERLSKSLTLAALAKAIGTQKGYISGIENEKVNPPAPRLIQRLCKVLGLNYSMMLARSAFEKLPKDLLYHDLEAILDEARLDGISESSGSVTGR
jgi:transcriptional regulator with XRE-family HTH domain